MASESRFTSQNKTTQERISNNTVGLVALSDFRKRRAEVLEQQEREAREAASSTSAPDRSSTSTPDNAKGLAPPPKKKKKKKVGGAKLSFGDDEDEENNGDKKEDSSSKEESSENTKTTKLKVNSSVSVVPRAVTKSALRRETAERELLRREFLERQEVVKATKIAIPFVFYDGSNISGGTVTVKKGDFVWQFLDKSRKVGADLGVGEKANAQRAWARVGVDDLMLVRNNVIIPHHYNFLFFIMNKTLGPNGTILFNYDSEAPKPSAEPVASSDSAAQTLTTPSTPSTAQTLEGASDDPTLTKVVDRRWYSRNKHIYPASMWQEFDPEKDYQKEIRRDPGGNTFFYA